MRPHSEEEAESFRRSTMVSIDLDIGNWLMVSQPIVYPWKRFQVAAVIPMLFEVDTRRIQHPDPATPDPSTNAHPPVEPESHSTLSNPIM